MSLLFGNGQIVLGDPVEHDNTNSSKANKQPWRFMCSQQLLQTLWGVLLFFENLNCVAVCAVDTQSGRWLS